MLRGVVVFTIGVGPRCSASQRARAVLRDQQRRVEFELRRRTPARSVNGAGNREHSDCSSRRADQRTVPVVARRRG